MLTHAKIKQFRSLQQKKFRLLHKQYFIQGEKIVHEALKTGNQPDYIIANEQLLKKHPEWETYKGIEIASEKQLAKISSQKNPADVIAVMPYYEPELNVDWLKTILSIGLDCIQDPGNLGTIIRIADWFGISDVLCSVDTVDVTNPKVVQASMGSLFRVRVHYVDLALQVQKIRASTDNYTVYGTYMDGDSIYDKKLKNKGLLLMGNEGRGISQALEPLCDEKISVPGYPREGTAPDSLNISVSAGIFCSEFRR
ncbi:MAG: RNA methyltransferase [Candidatus Delongbacteria bacterium]|jgi:TrmH family RNA methyltransferase|nr:RNA methyltransferase [Candidatus Delongbacteria bacterium]